MGERHTNPNRNSHRTGKYGNGYVDTPTFCNAGIHTDAKSPTRANLNAFAIDDTGEFFTLDYPALNLFFSALTASCHQHTPDCMIG